MNENTEVFQRIFMDAFKTLIQMFQNLNQNYVDLNLAHNFDWNFFYVLWVPLQSMKNYNEQNFFSVFMNNCFFFQHFQIQDILR